ncbi:MAG TPA: DUF1343 domain-containing protein [Candidatus Sulfotelmatobacter sp.]|nr:DUF1343 domain-containing protein [Candidatus Sulfotelmatobacter sp.]
MQNFFILTFFLAAFLLAGCQTMHTQNSSSRPPVKLGDEVLFEKRLDLIRGKRVGLITNPTGLDSHLDSIIERFRACPDTKLVALYGPEHGVRGNAQAGEFVAYYYDEHFHLPVFSLYGQTHTPPPDMMTNIDEYMRTFDTKHEGKQVEAGMIESVDVMIFDLQDVGTRVYTYVGTMGNAMEAATKAGLPFIVLDRPNPINGVAMEGPILEYPEFSSFIGHYPIPLRHGMTTGEIAQFINAKFLGGKCNLTVVKMENWTRDEWFDETSLPWTLPSPNLPTLESATVYPGQVIVEGTNLSEGRGTTKPFEFFGAPWIDGYVLAKRLNGLNLPGVKFREVYFTPTFSKFSGTNCGGCQMYVTDRAKFNAVVTTLNILTEIKKVYGDKLELHKSYFDHVMGTSSVREAFERGEPVDKIVAAYQPGLDEFAKTREPYLLYR